MNVISTNSFVIIDQKDLTNDEILNEKLTKACSIGFFYLEIPEDCKKLIENTIEFANSFYKNEVIKNLRFGREEFSGYHDRKYQVESLYLEQKYWQEAYVPVEVGKLAEKMTNIAIDLLKKTLSFCCIPKEKWNLTTGGLTEGKGMVHFSLNHYRPEKEQEGLDAHRDFNQVTVLFINQLGLQAKVNGEWTDVPPLKDRFVINFGRTIETLVNNPKQLIAAEHRVQKVTKDRISFGIFADNEMESDVYERSREGNLVKVETYREYIKKCFAETY